MRAKRMHGTRITNYFFFFAILSLIFIFSTYIQSTVLLSWDVSWGLHEARRIFAGGIYGKEIFEATPPLFLYLYAPAIWLSDFLQISIANALRIYLNILSILSLCFCYRSVVAIFNENQLFKAIMLLGIASALLLLPLPYDTGQREHLLFVLTLPYFFLVASALEKNSHPSKIYAAIIGLMAGFGFAIKPFFFLPFVLTEFYYAYQKRNILTWWRIDALIIIFISLLQLLGILFWHPEYFTKIAPLFMHFYYQGYSSDWMFVLFHPAILFCEFTVLFFISEYITNPYKELCMILLIAMFGFTFIHIIQRTFWYYHLYPAFSDALLLTLLLFSLFVTRVKKSYDYFAAGILCIFIFLFLFANVPDFVVSLVGFRFATAIFISIIIIFIMFLLNVTNERIQFKTIAFLLFFGIVIFIFPYHLAHTRYLLSEKYKKKMQPLITFLSDYATKKPVYFFSAAMSIEFPAVDYANAIPVSRYPALIWVPGLLNQTQQTLDFSWQPKLKEVNDYFVKSVIDEIQKNKPAYVFVDTLPGLYLKKPFSYVDYFSMNSDFRSAWREYRYFATIDGGEYFRLDVYQRMNAFF